MLLRSTASDCWMNLVKDSADVSSSYSVDISMSPSDTTVGTLYNVLMAVPKAPPTNTPKLFGVDLFGVLGVLGVVRF